MNTPSSVQGLVGIIMFSQDPGRLAGFYRDTLGIPFDLAQHGQLAEHIECEFGGIHFAILKKGQTADGGSLIPSFRVENLRAFFEQHPVQPLHPILDIGDGKSVSTIKDVDGNAVRLIQLETALEV